MKRCFVILPVGQAVYPDWFYQPMPVICGVGPDVTHYASLLIGEVPAHHGATVEILPSDTIKSALARAGFTRALTAAGRAHRPLPVAAPTVPSPISTNPPRPVRPPEPTPVSPPSLWGRVKKFFGSK